MDQIVVDLGENPHGVDTGQEAVIFGNGEYRPRISPRRQELLTMR